MVWRRRNSVATYGYHSRLGDVAHYLRTGEMSADTRFCALTYLDFYALACLKIIFVYAESTRSDLNYSILSVLIKVLVKSALARIVEYTQLLRGFGKRSVSIVADRTVAHCGKHYRRA